MLHEVNYLKTILRAFNIDFKSIFHHLLLQNVSKTVYGNTEFLVYFKVSQLTALYNHLKSKIYILLHPEKGNTAWDRLFNLFIIILILLNIIAVMLETVAPIYETYESFFYFFDLVSIIIFTIEYLLRVWSCTVEPKYMHPVYGRLRYLFTLGMLIDLLAILPFYLHILVGFDLRMLRLLRLLRFLRVFHLTSNMKATRLIMRVFRSRKNELLISLILLFFLLIISSCLIYFAEHAAQPDQFTSIPHTLWWSVITLTTVGYGDMIPVTTVGKALTGVILLSGVALFALPAGIITAGFLEESRKSRKPTSPQCPHCGMPLSDGEHGEHKVY